MAGLTRTSEISFYRSLIPVGFVLRVWNAQDEKDLTPGAYKYKGSIIPVTFSIFRDWKDQNYLSAPSSRISNGAFEQDFVMLTRAGEITGDGGSNPFAPSYIQLVPDTILQNLFGTDSGQLGVWKPDFYRNWPFARFYCNAPSNVIGEPDDPDQPLSSCDFTTPQLPQ